MHNLYLTNIFSPIFISLKYSQAPAIFKYAYKQISYGRIITFIKRENIEENIIFENINNTCFSYLIKAKIDGAKCDTDFFFHINWNFLLTILS